METAKSGLVQKCDPFWAVCKADREISPGGRQGRDVCRPEGNTEGFSPCHVCVGKATTERAFLPAMSAWESHRCCFAGLWWKSQAGYWTQKPILASFSRQDWEAWTSSSPCSSHRDWQAPGLDSCGCRTAVLWAGCCWGSTLSAERPPHTSTDHDPREAQSLLQASVTYKWTIYLSAQCSHQGVKSFVTLWRFK